MIAILCPTRGRPEQCKRMIESAKSTSSVHIEIALALDNMDQYENCLELMDGRITLFRHVLPENLPTAHKWNILCDNLIKNRVRPHKLFMLGADDMIFETPGWDKALIDHYNALENKIHVYALRDSRDPLGTPHPIVTREHIEALGYFMPPIFLHWFVDTWTIGISKANGAFTHLDQYLLRHDKPSDQGKPDETHSRIREWGWHERDKWVAERCKEYLNFEKMRLAMAIDKSNGIYPGPVGTKGISYLINEGIIERS